MSKETVPMTLLHLSRSPGTYHLLCLWHLLLKETHIDARYRQRVICSLKDDTGYIQSPCSAQNSDSHTPSLSSSYDSIFTCSQLSHHLSSQARDAVFCSLSYLRFMSPLLGKTTPWSLRELIMACFPLMTAMSCYVSVTYPRVRYRIERQGRNGITEGQIVSQCNGIQLTHVIVCFFVLQYCLSFQGWESNIDVPFMDEPSTDTGIGSFEMFLQTPGSFLLQECYTKGVCMCVWMHASICLCVCVEACTCRSQKKMLDVPLYHFIITRMQALFLIMSLIFSHICQKPASPSNAPLEVVLQI